MRAATPGAPHPTHVIYAHGAGSSPTDAPLPALRDLLGRNYRITAPDLGPPDPQAWTAALTPLLRDHGAQAILVGHSLGGSHILKCLAELGPAVQPRAFVGLACPLWGQPGWESAEFALPAWAPDALSRLPIRLFHARDDTVVPPDHLQEWATVLPQARCHSIAKGGHEFTEGLSSVAMAIAEL
ncbi:alpha/beta hydrolase [Pseudooceanicola sp.]|uniref:alpha/beta hydrolase n=1 Tax=Pseudooceanicola sp. TaxID=1914328 RepID=UPI0035C75F5E